MGIEGIGIGENAGVTIFGFAVALLLLGALLSATFFDMKCFLTNTVSSSFSFADSFSAPFVDDLRFSGVLILPIMGLFGNSWVKVVLFDFNVMPLSLLSTARNYPTFVQRLFLRVLKKAAYLLQNCTMSLL